MADILGNVTEFGITDDSRQTATEGERRSDSFNGDEWNGVGGGVRYAGTGIVKNFSIIDEKLAESTTTVPKGIPSAEAWGKPVAGTENELKAGSGIPSEERFGAGHDLLPKDFLGVAASIASFESFGAPAPRQRSFIQPVGFEDVKVIREPGSGGNGGTVRQGLGIPSAERVGTPRVAPPADLFAPGSLPSQEAFGEPEFRKQFRLVGGGIDSGETFPEPELKSTAQRVRTAHSITTEEAFGYPRSLVIGGTPPPVTTHPPQPDETDYRDDQEQLIGELEARRDRIATVNRLLSAGMLRKKSRFTRLELNYPETLERPYTPRIGYPRVERETRLTNPISYTVQESDHLASGYLTLEAANTSEGLFTSMAEHNDLLRVEERYSDAEGNTTGWFTVGTYLVDSVNPSTTGEANQITVTARDAFKLLTFPGFELSLLPDVIRVPRKRLKMKVDPNRDSTKQHYTFVDGDYLESEQRWVHTFNWADPPVPRLYDGNTSKRISFSEGSIQLLYGTGEIIIDKEYYEAPVRQGGLAKPKHIEMEYARYCLPEDERRYVVTAISADGKTVTLGQGRRVDDPPGAREEPLYAWQRQLTAVALTGAAKNARFRVIEVNPSARTVTLDRSGVGAGLGVGDDLRLGEGARLEHAVERILMDAGFQNLDRSAPFYMRVQKPNTQKSQPDAQLYVPSVDEFDFSRKYGGTFLQAYQQLEQALIPPFMRLYMNTEAAAVYRTVQQSELPHYSVDSEVIRASVESTDQDLYTRVRYFVRDRDLVNLTYLGNEPKRYSRFVLYNPKLDKGTGDRSRGNYLWRGIKANSYLEVWRNGEEWKGAPPRRLKGESEWEHFTRQCEHALFDSKSRTAITIENDDPGTSYATMFDGIPVFHVEFPDKFKLRQINMTCWPWNEGVTHTNQFWLIEHSLDGVYWEDLGDEFNFDGDGRKTLDTGHFGEVEVRFLRWRIAQASTARVNVKKGPVKSSNKYAFASMATVQVYGDDVIEGVAELGVDRFDLNTPVRSIGSDYLEIAHAVESRWLRQPMWVDGYQFRATGGSGNRIYVPFDPRQLGVGIGSLVSIPEGETDSDFARDQERRRRLGRRTYTLPTVDEVGYYFVEQVKKGNKDYSLKQYAEDRAREYLAELSRESLPTTLTTIRPDMQLGDTVLVDVQQLGFKGSVLVEEITRQTDTTLQFRAAPYRDYLLRTFTASVTASFTHPPVEWEYEEDEFNTEPVGDEPDPEPTPTTAPPTVTLPPLPWIGTRATGRATFGCVARVEPRSNRTEVRPVGLAAPTGFGVPEVEE